MALRDNEQQWIGEQLLEPENVIAGLERQDGKVDLTLEKPV